jgi:Zn-dependent M28 family amino/carboxypeptidase
MEILAADSMEGRRTGTAGSARAARFIEERFRAAGLEAAGDSGFYQLVPMSLAAGRSGRVRPRLLDSWAAWDTLPPVGRIKEANIVGVLRGSDPALRDEYVVVTAHYDHVGIGRPVDGDSIYNGADDDASGTAALIWIAETLAALETRPARSIVFAAVTGEEMGLLGTRWYITDPPVPLDQTVANLNIEMIARPDPAVGPGHAWLTGFERTTMGEMLAAAGLPIEPDPYPEQNYHERSDNIAFARVGIPAHTLSTYGGHGQYHTPDDESERADPEHVAAIAEVAVRAVTELANGAAPVWKAVARP